MNHRAETTKRLVTALSLLLCLSGLASAQEIESPFRPIGLPSSRSSSPVFNRYASLPPFTAEQPEQGEWFLIPAMEISQGMTAAWVTKTNGSRVLATPLDYETLSLELPLSYGLTDSISLEADLQVQYLWGGFCDSIIEPFHSLFGFPNGGRELFARNRIEINIQTVNGFELRRDSPGLLVSDPVFGAAFGIVKTPRAALTGRILGAVPLGLGAGLYGAELPQIGAGLYFDWHVFSRLGVNAALGGILPMESFGWTASHPKPMVQARFSVLAEPVPGFVLFIDLNFHDSPIETTIYDYEVYRFAIPNADLLIGFIFTGTSATREGRFGSFSFQEDPITHNASDITFKGTGAFRW